MYFSTRFWQKRIRQKLLSANSSSISIRMAETAEHRFVQFEQSMRQVRTRQHVNTRQNHFDCRTLYIIILQCAVQKIHHIFRMLLSLRRLDESFRLRSFYCKFNVIPFRWNSSVIHQMESSISCVSIHETIVRFVVSFYIIKVGGHFLYTQLHGRAAVATDRGRQLKLGAPKHPSDTYRTFYFQL